MRNINIGWLYDGSGFGFYGVSFLLTFLMVNVLYGIDIPLLKNL